MHKILLLAFLFFLPSIGMGQIWNDISIDGITCSQGENSNIVFGGTSGKIFIINRDVKIMGSAVHRKRIQLCQLRFSIYVNRQRIRLRQADHSGMALLPRESAIWFESKLKLRNRDLSEVVTAFQGPKFGEVTVSTFPRRRGWTPCPGEEGYSPTLDLTLTYRGFIRNTTNQQATFAGIEREDKELKSVFHFEAESC
ncbi:MAG: hypothetical protein HRU19_26170 [Pseudobacteriovorax sp.]|nr:hypothetical protein [Pseudobacteriovorax sp.]